MTLVFLPQKPTYDLGKGVVQFVGRDGDKLVLCGVTTAALKDAASLRRATVDHYWSCTRPIRSAFIRLPTPNIDCIDMTNMDSS